jgi:hypothetical protein
MDRTYDRNMLDADHADEPGPLVDVELPSGNFVQATLQQRRQEQDGSWWYRLTVAAWGKAETPGGDVHAVPDDIVFDAPAAMVRPITGLERAYADVPTWRHPAWLRRRHRAPRRTPPAPWDAPAG